ncbi:hypothetical protein BMT55_02245 [Listeria newyorkensis]|uniref:Uncharacterized protein n=1 Tax=Listeria newyorkensis TaxID=1497681 RepID=A0ABX4XQ98_9LIST|nr:MULTISPECIES: hypothetical protein [Listeria]KGL42194.1 hypothetical protein EP56_10695 [Listeriaceae bacterium FSL A5-0209]KGL38213.1 hypothetical protein EP58_15760 [Listeria newyorkensis]PNP94328.1 hypothetical protein BMT55_02245 [Listeria newyorkensis]RQW67712.1 hypothetical protein DUK53_05180 [Listeria sp. SHR_NRA_18]WAO22743.1 hypothetical protein OTR81_05585 [Listeria newyorkensis]
MALEISIVNKSQNKLTQKAFIYIDGQQKTTNIKQLEPGEECQIEIPTTEKDVTSDIMLSYLNTDSAIIITKMGEVTSQAQNMLLDITDIAPEGTIRYQFS